MRLPSLLFLLVFVSACGPPARRNIGVRSLGAFPQPLRDSIASAIGRCYGMRVVLLPPRAIPAAYFNDEKSPRYCADSILRFLGRSLPDSLDRNIGLTAADIYTRKKDESGRPMRPAAQYANWGIFGLGERPGRSCVVSIARLGRGTRSCCASAPSR